MTPAQEWFVSLTEDQQQRAMWGIHYGYPSCCIVDFLFRDMAIDAHPVQIDVSRHTGFIPCKECADKVSKGELKLEELITDRKAKFDFPIGDNDR